ILERGIAMSQRTFGEDVATELTAKAVIWGPGIVCTALLGPVGLLVGAAVSAAIIASGSGGNQSPPPPPPTKS
ncbi:MAG TPA: hypothetical protein VN648_17535, partial [Candidatus Methylomirabilis sp.]|nr:hypothetical protein [Candidatus Methylomirabilis sp.]